MLSSYSTRVDHTTSTFIVIIFGNTDVFQMFIIKCGFSYFFNKVQRNIILITVPVVRNANHKKIFEIKTITASC